MKNKILHIVAAVVLIFGASCTKHPMNIQQPGTEGVYVLDQGNYNAGNGEVTFYDPVSQQVINNLFFSINGFHPGDVVQSMYIVDSFGFIVVNNSQRILEVKIPSFKWVKTDTIPNSSPRYFLPLNDSIAYVTELYKSRVDVLNYRTGAVVSHITGVCQWTEHMVQIGNNVVVEEDNLGTTPATNDSLVVINTTTNSVIGQYTYPGGGAFGITVDYQNRIWMASDENPADSIHAAIYCLNSDMSINKTLVFPYGHHPSNICIDGGGQTLYFIDGGIFTITINDVLVPTNPWVAVGGHNFYGLGVDPNSGDVYAADALNYVENSMIYRYDRNANQLNSFAAGSAPEISLSMANKFRFSIFPINAICLLFLWSCHQPESRSNNEAKHNYQKISQLPVKYAKGFSVDYYSGFTLVSVKDLMDSSKIIARYILIPKGDSAPAGFEDAVVIETPVHKVVCISTTHFTEMNRLGLTDSIAAVTNVPLIYNKEITSRVKQNTIADIGNEELNYEKLLELHPSFIFTSGDYDGGDKMKLKLNTLHIKQVLNLEYKEQDPLARAEWLKFIAAFYNCEPKADSIFNVIEKNYLQLEQQVKNANTKPTVFCNIPFKEIWYMPCGDNYIAKLITDAGGNFLWKDAVAANGLNLNLDYEAVYNKAANADVWLNPGIANSLAEIKAADKKNTFFKAFKTGEVYNNNKRNTPDGGFDFWESGVVNPDKILADLIFIFHPDLLPRHELYYYQKLK